MNRKTIILPLLVSFLSGGLVSCKPTEQNYKAAYDTALLKKREATGDADLNIPEGTLITDDNDPKKETPGLQYRLVTKFISPLESGRPFGKFNVAVASFKMPTNCNALTARLKQEGYDAFSVRDADDRFYTIAASCPSKEEASAFVRDYLKKHSDESLIGLDGKPLIIEKPR